MKILFFLSATLLSFNFYSQCTPDPSVTNVYEPVGFIPIPTEGKLSPTQFFCYPGQSFDKVLTALAPQSMEIANPIMFPPTIVVDINWIRVTSINNLPSWLDYSCGGQLDPTDPCKLAFPTWSCVRAFATTPDGKVPMTEIPGTAYSLDVIVDADVTPIGTQSNYNGGSISLLVLDSITMDIEYNPCNGGKLTANAQGGFNDNFAFEYLWNNSSTTPVIEGVQDGWYICTVTDFVTGWSAVDSVLVSNVLPTIEITNENIVDPVGISDGSISITASGGTGTLTYSWSGPNGYTAQGTSISNLVPGYYTLTVTDANGCSIERVINLGSVSIEEESPIQKVSIYPNPTSDFIIIENVNDTQSLMVELYATDGRLVKSVKLASINSSYQLQVDDLNTGLYRLKMYAGDKTLVRNITVK